ncbi:MAG: pilus assembly protein [Clostridia bacterium]|jgi:pilus assembly protein CpaF|nr:pilus assembly protein [Clostridia bacterium]
MSNSKLTSIIENIRSLVRENLDFNRDLNDEDILSLITDLVFEQAGKSYISANDKKEIINSVFNSIRRLDVLQPLLDNPQITEIMVNGAKEIFIEKNGGTYRVDASFESTERLEDVIQSIVGKVNRTVNEASPIVDARLADGSRVSVVLPPIALNGPILTIRKFSDKGISIDRLVEWESISREAVELIEVLVKAKYNIFICGGTGSGKTTLLNVLAQFIPRDERVITIEDSAELQINNIDNIVKLETRNENTEGKGEITIRELIKASLRMRPDRIIVGEVRGAEALDMLQAMNTGHDGSISTGHANSCKDMLSRLETMVLSGAALPLEAIRQQIASALDIMIHLSRMRDKSRRVLEISEVLGCKDGQIMLNPLFIFQETAESTGERISGSLCRTENKLINTQKLAMSGFNI